MSRRDNLWTTQSRHSQQSQEHHLPDKAPFMALADTYSFPNTVHILLTYSFPFSLSVPSITLLLSLFFFLCCLAAAPPSNPVGSLPRTQHAHRHACRCFETLPDTTGEGGGGREPAIWLDGPGAKTNHSQLASLAGEHVTDCRVIITTAVRRREKGGGSERVGDTSGDGNLVWEEKELDNDNKVKKGNMRAGWNGEAVWMKCGAAEM